MDFYFLKPVVADRLAQKLHLTLPIGMQPGVSVENWDPRVIVVYPISPWGSFDLADLIAMPFYMCSSRLRTLLESTVGSQVQFLPVRLLRSDAEGEIFGYSICVPLDAYSEAVESSQQDVAERSEEMGVSKLERTEESKCSLKWHPRNFRPVVSQELRRRILEASFSGIVLSEKVPS